MTDKQLRDWIEDYGLEYILFALDLEPFDVIRALKDRGWIEDEDLEELFDDREVYEDDTEDDVWY